MIDIPNSNAGKVPGRRAANGRTDALVQEAARRAGLKERVLFVCARESDKRAVGQRIDAALRLCALRNALAEELSRGDCDRTSC